MVKVAVKVEVKAEVKVEVKVTVGVENLKVVKIHQNRCGISLMKVIDIYKHLFDLFYSLYFPPQMVRSPETRVKWRF